MNPLSDLRRSSGRSKAASLLLVGMFLCLVTPATLSQPYPREDEIARLNQAMALIETELRRQVSSAQIASIEERILYINEQIRDILAQSADEAQQQRRLLESLGPAPEEGDPPELPTVSAERDRLTSVVALFEDRVHAANIMRARMKSIREDIAKFHIASLARLLAVRTQTPFSSAMLQRAWNGLPHQIALTKLELSAWWDALEFNEARMSLIAWWLVLLIGLIALVLFARRWLLKRYGIDRSLVTPTYVRRFQAAGAVALSNVVLPLVGVLGMYYVLVKTAGFTPEVHVMVTILAVALLHFFVATGLSAAVLAPAHPSWKISRFTDEAAAGLYGAIVLFASTGLALNMLRIPLSQTASMGEIGQFLVIDASASAVGSVFVMVALFIIALVVLNLFRKRYWRFVDLDDSGQTVVRGPSPLIKGLLIVARLGVVVSVVAGLIGYVNFGLYLIQRLVWTVLLLALVYLIRSLLADLCNQAKQDSSEVGQFLRKTLRFSDRGAGQLMFWSMLIIDVVLAVMVTVALLVFWGADVQDIYATVRDMVAGFRLGNITISMADIGVAIALFVTLMIVVRLFQRFLSERVLPQAVHDTGLNDAVTTGIGYVGIVFAAFVAISALGLELSQLALIFGALSVGIGFGLQNVVNNFVSGLILLIQRPIKAGDWVVVGLQEGYVKKINAISTEIQTFDNASLIVPNGNLVANEMLNWTYKSKVGRVIVAVSVSYDSDPEQVRDVLMQVAEDDEDILGRPQPMVIFRDFGESGLLFELRFFIREADYMIFIASNVRFAIAKAFREAGIEIPYPQRDIHIKTPGRTQDFLPDPQEA